MKIEKIKVSIDRDDVCNLLTMEAGGFDYWAEIDYKEADYLKAKDEMHLKHIPSYFSDERYCYEEVLAYMICDTDYKVWVYDFEEDKRYRLTKTRIENGFTLNAEKRPQDSNLEEGDSTTGDCILQYAIFGDIIYG